MRHDSDEIEHPSVPVLRELKCRLRTSANGSLKMPRNRNKKNGGGGKKKKGGGGRGGARVTRVGLFGINDRCRVKLKYDMVSALTSIVTTGAFSYVFRGNSVFDPDFTSTGGQPSNFDDYSAMYGNYRVWGSTMKVHIMATTSALEPTLWAIGPRRTSTSITAATQPDFIAQPYCKSVLTNVYRTGAPDTKYNGHMSSARLLGLTNTEFAGRDDATAATGANPTLQWYWHISATNIDTAVTSEVAIHVELVYDVEFYSRIDTTIDIVGRAQRAIQLRQAFLQSQGGKPVLGRATGQEQKIDKYLMSEDFEVISDSKSPGVVDPGGIMRSVRVPCTSLTPQTEKKERKQPRVFTFGLPGGPPSYVNALRGGAPGEV